MKQAAFLPLLLVLLFVNGFGQTSTPDTSISPKIYRGEENFLRPFEPYQARYKISSEIAGLDFLSLKTSTRIVDLDDQWRETFAVMLPFQSEVLQVLRIVSEIDKSTGLLKKIEYKFAENLEEYTFTDGKITLVQTRGDKVRQFVFDNPEQIYPCSYATAFYASLPLDEKFDASFTCFMPDTDSKPKISFHRLNIKVVKSEKIATAQGLIDCYKIESRSERIDQNTSKKPSDQKEKIADLSVKNLRQANFGNVWIDKNSGKMVKAEMNSKTNGIFLEIED